MNNLNKLRIPLFHGVSFGVTLIPAEFRLFVRSALHQATLYHYDWEPRINSAVFLVVVPRVFSGLYYLTLCW